MENIPTVIQFLSEHGFLYEKQDLTLEEYISMTERKAVELILKNRVLTAGDEARIGFYIRAKALDEEISKFESGVAVLSIALSINSQIPGESSAIIAENMRSKGCRTVGEFLFFTGPAGERIVKHSDLTNLFKAELAKIWKKQASYNPSTYNEDLKERISGVIFGPED
jgi:hypothetical protein